MSEYDEDEDEDEDEDDYIALAGADVSHGKIADSPKLYSGLIPDKISNKFEIYSYRGAAAVLAQSFPKQFSQIITALDKLQISTTMIRMPGGSKGPVAKHIEKLFDSNWQETRISADLNVSLHHAREDTLLRNYTRNGFLDGHRIDFVNGKVAVDLEWNSKDQTYDRDLYALSAFHLAGAIDVGVLITRGLTLDKKFFKSLGKVLKKDGAEGEADTYKKFGASTTWMGKLLYRLDAGRNGGCPVLAIGITPKCVKDE